jgi:hypothetical protein
MQTLQRGRAHEDSAGEAGMSNTLLSQKQRKRLIAARMWPGEPKKYRKPSVEGYAASRSAKLVETLRAWTGLGIRERRRRVGQDGDSYRWQRQ